MNTMLKSCAIGVLIVGSIGGLVMQHAGITQLREELVTARHRAETRLQSHSGRAMQAPKAQADLKSKDPGPANFRVDAEARTAANEFPWKDKGNASPESALETAMWAASRGDVDTIARLLVFEPKARAIAESLRASLPDSGRIQFPTDESLIALLLARQAPLEGIEVVGRSDIANGGVLLQVAMTGPKATSKQAEFAFVKGAEGWHLVVTSELASHAAHLLRR